MRWLLFILSLLLLGWGLNACGPSKPCDGKCTAEQVCQNNVCVSSDAGRESVSEDSKEETGNERGEKEEPHSKEESGSSRENPKENPKEETTREESIVDEPSQEKEVDEPSQEKEKEVMEEILREEPKIPEEVRTEEGIHNESNSPDGGEITADERVMEVTPEPPPESKPEPPSKLPQYVDCQQNSDCQSGLCKDPGGLGKKVCTKVCSFSGANVCGVGTNQGICEDHSGVAKVGYCVPTCKTSKDCASYASMPNCNIEKHCWKSWRPVGWPCDPSEPSECIKSICKDSGIGFTICTKPCQNDVNCGTGFVCYKKKGATLGFCMKACKTDTECRQHDPSITKCKSGTCWIP